MLLHFYRQRHNNVSARYEIIYEFILTRTFHIIKYDSRHFIRRYNVVYSRKFIKTTPFSKSQVASQDNSVVNVKTFILTFDASQNTSTDVRNFVTSQRPGRWMGIIFSVVNNILRAR